MSQMFVRVLSLIVVFVATATTVSAQAVSFSGTTYTQNFNSLSNVNSSATVANTTMLQVSSQAGGGSVSGWYIYGTGSGTRWGVTDGTSSSGSFFAMTSAASGSTNQALGSQGSGSNAGFFGVVLQNTSGSTINSISISYDAVINRNPSATGIANPYPLSYLISSTDIAAASGTGAGTFNNGAGSWNSTTLGFTTPTTGTGAPGTQAAINPLFTIGTGLGGNLTGLNWGAGQFLYFRWAETDNTGSDSTAGVDNFSLGVLAFRNVTWNLSTGGNWDLATTNWTTGVGSTAFTNTDNVTFNNTAGGVINLTATVSPTSVTVSAASGTYTFSGTGKISGTTALAKSGGGTLIVTNDNDYTGGTSITGGILQIDGANRLGTGAINLNGGTLTSASATPLILANSMQVGATGGTIDTGSQNLSVATFASLAGVLTKTGAANLTVTGNFVPSTGGGVSVAAGNLILNQASGIVTLGASGTLTGNLVLSGPIRLNVTDSAIVSGTGQVQVVSSGTLISTLSGGVGGFITAPIALNSTGVAFTPGSWTGNTYTSASFTSTIGGTTGGGITAGIISGDSDVDFSNNSTTGGGTGYLQLNAVSTYTGNTTINANTPVGQTYNVRLGINNALPTTTGIIVGTKTGIGAAVLDLNGFNQQVVYLADGANVTASKFLKITNTGTSDSTLNIGSSVTAGTSVFSGVFADGSTNKLNLVKSGTNTQTLTGVSTYTGTTLITGGTLALSGSATINGTSQINVSNGATFDVTGIAGAYTIGGSATQLLTGAGTITGGISIGATGTLKPGTSASNRTLTAASNVTLTTGSAFTSTLYGIGYTSVSNNDMSTLSVTGNFNGADVSSLRLDLSAINATDANTMREGSGRVYTIVSAGNSPTNFTGIDSANSNFGFFSPAEWSLVSSPDANTIQVLYTPIPVPEPATILGFSVVGLALARRLRKLC